MEEIFYGVTGRRKQRAKTQESIVEDQEKVTTEPEIFRQLKKLKKKKAAGEGI